MSSLFSRYSASITDTSGYCGNESLCSICILTDERCGIKFSEKTRFEIRGSTPKDMVLAWLVPVGFCGTFQTIDGFGQIRSLVILQLRADRGVKSAQRFDRRHHAPGLFSDFIDRRFQQVYRDPQLSAVTVAVPFLVKGELQMRQHVSELYDYVEELLLGVAFLQRTQEVVPNCAVTILRAAAEAFDAAPDSVGIYDRLCIAKQVLSDAKDFLPLLLELSRHARAFLSQKMEEGVCANRSAGESYQERCDNS